MSSKFNSLDEAFTSLRPALYSAVLYFGQTRGRTQPSASWAAAWECGRIGLWMLGVFKVGSTYGRQHGSPLMMRVQQIHAKANAIRLEPGTVKSGTWGKVCKKSAMKWVYQDSTSTIRGEPLLGTCDRCTYRGTDASNNAPRAGFVTLPIALRGKASTIRSRDGTL
jgi:hypothetical protein